MRGRKKRKYKRGKKWRRKEEGEGEVEKGIGWREEGRVKRSGERIDRKRKEMGIGWKREAGEEGDRIEEGREENEARRTKDRKRREKKKGSEGRDE